MGKERTGKLLPQIVNLHGKDVIAQLLSQEVYELFMSYKIKADSILDQPSLYPVRGLSIPHSIIEHHWYTYLHSTHSLRCIPRPDSCGFTSRIEEKYGLHQRIRR